MTPFYFIPESKAKPKVLQSIITQSSLGGVQMNYSKNVLLKMKPLPAVSQQCQSLTTPNYLE